MNDNTRENIPSELEIQNNELNEEQLDEVNGGILTIRLGACYRRCAGRPSHNYVARKADDVCPICGEKKFLEVKGF